MLKELSDYESATTKFTIFVTGLIGWVVNKYFDWNAHLAGATELLAYGGLIIIAMFLDSIITKLHSHSVRLRRFLLGNRHLEGVWAEIVRNGSPSSDITGIGFCFIRVYNSMYFIDGHAFKMDGCGDNWKSSHTVLSYDGDLDIMYKLSASKTGVGDIFGYCKYSFTIPSEKIPPDYYSGSYIYPLDGKTYFVEGKKIKDKKLTAQIQMASSGDFSKCAEVVSRYFRIPTISDEKIRVIK